MDSLNSKNMNELDSYELSQLKYLLSSLCEGMLDEAEAKHLRELLNRSEEARGMYIEYLHMHASLAYTQSRPTQETPNSQQATVEPRTLFTARFEEWKSWGGDVLAGAPRTVASVAALFLGVAALLFLFLNAKNTPSPFTRSRVQYVARVVRDVDCRWGKETVAAVQGGLLHCQDELDLLEGMAKLRFDCGAEVILRGPAKLRIDSGMRCFLTSGELSAIVPEVAQGFTVDTPLGRVVDLGTAFGVNVDEEIEVQVFEGELELHPEKRATCQKGSPQVASGPAGETVGLLAGAGRRMALDDEGSVVRVLELPDPQHIFSRSLPLLENSPANGSPERSHISALAVDSFGQGGPGTRLLGRNGGFGWDGPWINTPDSNSVSFLLGTEGAISRGSGSGVIQRLLSPELASAKQLYFSAEFQVDGPDTHCSAWLELFKFIPHYWSNGDTNLAVIGLTDGQFSARLAPFQSQKVEQALGDCGQYLEGSRHLIVGKLEFDAVGEKERLSLWTNPTLADETTPDKVILRDTGRKGADAIAIRCWEIDSKTVATFDEVRVGRSWIDVVQ